jgi:hypothetical protein
LSIEAEIFLLGQKGITEAFLDYRNALLEFSQKFLPSSAPGGTEELKDSSDNINELRKVLSDALSKVYLMNHKST